MVLWAHHQVQKPKRHISRLSHFVGITIMTNVHRQTDRSCYSICKKGLIHICERFKCQKMEYMQIVIRFIAKSVHLHYTAPKVCICKYCVIHKPHPLVPLWKSWGRVCHPLWWTAMTETQQSYSILCTDEAWIWMRVCSNSVQSIHRLQQISTNIVVIALHSYMKFSPKSAMAQLHHY